MEPLDEQELHTLLQKWEAPPAPSALRPRVLPARKSLWRWMFTGSIRVPAPFAFAAVALILLMVFYAKPVPPAPSSQADGSVSLAEFQPVRQLEPVRLGEQK